ncbi:MAG TPA: hypothetical protein VGX68_15060 [Thermoanaerobaculia bacterium]|jgi:hypothetical protein|nr:hypothetical protein [Thermoanaerobaculia bacterium]
MKTPRSRGIYTWITFLALGFLSCQQLLAAPPVVDAYSRFRNGPFFLKSTASHNPEPNGTVQDVVKLDVTSGLYVIFAKGFVKAHGGGGTKLDCKLVAGADSDHVRVGVDGRENFRTNEEAFALNVLHSFSSNGTIVLRCSCDADDADLSSLKVTAIRVKSYWNLAQ